MHLKIDLVLSDVLNSGLIEHASSTSAGTVDPGFSTRAHSPSQVSDPTFPCFLFAVLSMLRLPTLCTQPVRRPRASPAAPAG